MKTKLILGLLAGCCLGAGETNTIPVRIPATLRWTLATNWAASGQSRTAMGWTGDKDPNITYYHETGTISSNLSAYIVWKGETSSVQLESIYIGTLYRSYTLSEPQRVYSR